MDQLTLEHALRRALENHELSLTYQPIFDLTSRKIRVMEVLVRWKHPDFGMMSPDIFVPIAEKSDLINHLGHWVFETACKQMKTWLAAGFRPKLAINISAQQILRPDFLPFIKKALADHQVPVHCIELELTETAMLPHAVHSEKVLHQLRDVGFELVIDDFGTGFSSLTHLKNLPVQAIKIDKSFLEASAHDQKSMIIINALIQLGLNLGLSVIAEGIETEEQLKFLVANDCVLGQGHYLSRPLTAEEMTELLAAE